MKFILLLIIPFISVVNLAQDCSKFFPFSEGKTWEMSSYNKKGKLENTSINSVTSVTTVDGGTKASVSIKMKDVKEKDEVEMTYDMTCVGDIVSVSMNMFLPAEQMEQMQGFEDMEVKMDMEDMDFPNDLSVGQDLKDCSMSMEVSTNGMKIMSSSTNIKDRKVLEKITITTAAGDFECYKITQTTAVSAGFISREFKSVSYISEGVGVVRSESFDKKGNLESYSELSKIN